MNVKRFAFIEAMLIEHGRINRGHLCRAFNISGPTATRIFRAYKNAYPENIKFEWTTKHYVTGNNFLAGNLDTNAARYLKAAQVMTQQQIMD